MLYTMNDPKIKQFIRKHSNLFWYIPEEKKEEISHELLLETILNYGTLEDCLQLFKLIGPKKALSLLSNMKGRKKGNFFPEIYNFFLLYLTKIAQGDIK